MQAIMYVLGAMFGVIRGIISLLAGFAGVFSILAGIVCVLVNPGLGVVLIMFGAIGVANVGHGRRRF